MFDAQLIVTDANAPEVFSPWFPRQADNAVFTLEIVAKQGSTKLTVQLFTKTTDDAGDGGAVASPTDVGSVGRTALPQEGEMQTLVRYRYTASAGSAGDWILFRLLPPVWYDTVKS